MSELSMTVTVEYYPVPNPLPPWADSSGPQGTL
jgi:hypothetical protein